MSAVIRNKRRADELESHKHHLDALPVAPAGVEWFFDNHFVPGTDCTEDPWLEFEAELKKSADVPFFSGVPTSTVFEPPVIGLKEESKPDSAEQQPSSLTSSASLGTVLRTCHHCKTVRACQPCVCTRTFCDRCVEKYPSLPQTTDPSGFRPQCPHCQELCTCARCRQRRAEEGPALKVRSQRSTTAVLKRQASEEDEEYAPPTATIVKAEPEFVPSVELRASEPVKIEPSKMVLDEQEFEACGSWPPEDLSLSTLGAAGSSSSTCSSRYKFVVSDDISNFMLSGSVRINSVSHRRSASVGCIAETIETVEVASCHRIQAVVSAPSFESVQVVKRDELMSLAPSFRDMLDEAAEEKAPGGEKPLGEPAAESAPSGASASEQEEDTGDDAYAARHARHESKTAASTPAAAPAPRQKKSRRLSDKLPKPRGSQGRKGSADSANAPSPSSERLVGPVCRECGTRTTPLWRAGPDGTKSLCNRCGIRWMRGVPLSRGPNSKACHAVADEVTAEHGRSRQVSCK